MKTTPSVAWASKAAKENVTRPKAEAAATAEAASTCQVWMMTIRSTMDTPRRSVLTTPRAKTITPVVRDMVAVNDLVAAEVTVEGNVVPLPDEASEVAVVTALTPKGLRTTSNIISRAMGQPALTIKDRARKTQGGCTLERMSSTTSTW